MGRQWWTLLGTDEFERPYHINELPCQIAAASCGSPLQGNANFEGMALARSGDENKLAYIPNIELFDPQPPSPHYAHYHQRCRLRWLSDAQPKAARGTSEVVRNEKDGIHTRRGAVVESPCVSNCGEGNTFSGPKAELVRLSLGGLGERRVLCF